MSKTIKPSNEPDFFKLLILGLIFVTLFPVVPITLILTLALYRSKKIRENGIIILSLSVTGLFAIILFFPQIANIFLIADKQSETQDNKGYVREYKKFLYFENLLYSFIYITEKYNSDRG